MRLLSWATLILVAANPLAAEDTVSNRLEFERDVAPILKTYCWKCHGGGGLAGELDLRKRELILRGGKNGPAIITGNPKESLLYKKLLSGEMPPAKTAEENVVYTPIKPSPDERAVVAEWISQGAPSDWVPRPLNEAEDPAITAADRRWWAFVPPQRPLLPRIESPLKASAVIDLFLLRKLESKQLSFSSPAHPEALVTRLYLDLTGLPPASADIASYIADSHPDRYERKVDELMASPSFGHHWGQYWLDAAGYNDVTGSDNDGAIIKLHDGKWRYRDYVISAHNQNMPYGQFLKEQLAGDELTTWRSAQKFTGPMKRKLIATGFLRQAADTSGEKELNTPDIRNRVLRDTVQMVSSSLMGLTLHCAQCHSHKFDPLSQGDYFRFTALFVPALNPQHWKHPGTRHLWSVTEAERTRIDQKNQTLNKSIAALRKQIDTASEKKPGPEEVMKLGKLREQVRSLGDQVEDYYKIQGLWELAEIPAFYLFRRGEYDKPGPRVKAGFIRVAQGDTLLAELDRLNPPVSSSGYRSALANWLNDPDHPLTARVYVNRVWQRYFGTGIVSTPDNFGRSGSEPTHPRLLDWLAREFVHTEGDIKRLHRSIVTSSAYRQKTESSGRQMLRRATAVDPGNRLLWRMPLRRLESGVIRDRILMASGLLNRRFGGPPVPLLPRPDGYVTVDRKKLPRPADEYRRSIYILARRNYHLTQLNVFDQPVLANNCTRRNSSAGVSQSLMMLNSQFTLEQAAHCSRRLLAETGSKDLIFLADCAFRLILNRSARATELDSARRLVLSNHPDTIESRLAELCHVLLNTNEFLYAP